MGINRKPNQPYSTRASTSARDRWAPAALLVLAAVGWAWSISAAGMGGMEGMARPAGLTDLVGFMLGWVAMMAAMMFPAIIPVVRLYALAAGKGSAAPLPYFVGGYLVVWSAAGLPAWAAWHGLQEPLAAASPWAGRLAGVVLLAAAVYQLTPWKTVCLRHCRSPLAFFLHHGRSIGTALGAARAGVAHGAFCLGCCWLLMVILVAFGTMHLGWMLALSALILLEKTASRGETVARAAAVAFAALGLLLILHPQTLGFLI